MEIELKQGQQVFKGVLVEFSDVQGQTKKDKKDFHFLKFNIDMTLLDREGKPYTRLAEFIADPSIASGVTYKKYAEVYCVFEIISPLQAPRLVNVIQNIG